MPRFAVFSDIHGNLAALEAVLEDLEKQRVDACWYLGDIVVYGPQPVQCVDRIRTACQHWEFTIVRGNNDEAVIQELQLKAESQKADGGLLARAGIVDPSDPHEVERQKFVTATNLSHAWTVKQLQSAPAQQDWLVHMSSRAQYPLEHVMLVHASPCDPIGREGNYLHDSPDAEEAWLSLELPLCFFGHTHHSLVFRRVCPDRLYDNTEKLARPTDPVPVDGRQLLVNPGSVGQPRDGLPTASYVIYDTDAQEIEFHRVWYDIAKTIQALRSTRQDLENIAPQLNANSKDVETTVELLSKRLEEAR